MCCFFNSKVHFFQENILCLNCLSVKLDESGLVVIMPVIGFCRRMRDVLLLKAKEDYCI